MPNQVNESYEKQVWNTFYDMKLNKKPNKPKFKVNDCTSLEPLGYSLDWTHQCCYRTLRSQRIRRGADQVHECHLIVPLS